MKHVALTPLLEALKLRAKTLTGDTVANYWAPGEGQDRVALADHVATSLNGMDSVTDEEVTALCKLMQEAVEGSDEARVSLNRIRVETVQRALLPMANFVSGFFDVVVLADDERPQVRSKGFNEMNFHYLSENGATKLGHWTTSEDSSYIPLATLASEEVPYRPKDIYRGRKVSENLLDTFNIAYDLAMQMESKVKTLLAAAVSGFTFTGKTSSRTAQAHSSLVTANLPTTNAITLTGNTSSTNFRTKVADAVFAYCTSWGVNASPMGALTPTGVIYVPAGDAAALLDEVPISGSANNPVAHALMQNYLRFERGGVLWTVVPDATLPLKICYPVLSQKVGTLYLKPSQDEVFDDSGTIESRRKNLAKRSQTKVVGAYIPEQNRPNFLKVTYRT